MVMGKNRNRRNADPQGYPRRPRQKCRIQKPKNSFQTHIISYGDLMPSVRSRDESSACARLKNNDVLEIWENVKKIKKA